MHQRLVPPFIFEKFQEHRFGGQFEAVSLFVDLSGFTQMTVKLMEHGIEGAEVLADILVSLFDPLVNIVYEQNGFITGFAGDAFTALFPLDSTVESSRPPAFNHGLAAASAIHEWVSSNHRVETKFGGFEFQVKLGLGTGQVEWGIIQTAPDSHLHTYYFKGEAIERCASAEHAARVDQIIITEDIRTLLGDDISASKVNSGFYLLESVHTDLPQPQGVTLPEMSRADQAAFVPPDVLDMEARGEFRLVTTVFISIRKLNSQETLMQFLQLIFRLLKQYSGTLTRLDFGDKGCNLLLFWGAPVHFENDLSRALSFALQLKELAAAELDATEPLFRIGMTHRRMYAGFAGANLQGEFTCYGHGINMAARMMMQAKWGEIWLDEQVAREATADFQVHFLERLPFKGFSEPQPVFTLQGRLELGRSRHFDGAFVGREAEMSQLRQLTQPLFGQGEHRFSGVAYIYGEAGMGKSRIVHELRQELLAHHSTFWMYCPADEILRQSLNPFRYFLRTFFQQQLNLSLDENKARFEQRYAKLLADLQPFATTATHKEIIDKVAQDRETLGGMIDISYPNSIFEQLDPKLRFENILGAFKNLCKAISLQQPLVISLDDAQWLDDDSKQMLQHLTRNVSEFPILILCVARYLDSNTPFLLNLDRDIPRVTIDLNVFQRSGIQTLAEQTLKQGISDAVTDFLERKTGGNPFFIEQLALDLKEQGFLIEQERDGITVLDLNKTELDSLPTTISGVLIARLDRLSHQVQETIKAAAVIGQEFEVRLLSHLLKRRVLETVKEAEKGRIWSEIQELQYIFKHTLFRDAAYEMQLRSRLRELHRQVAQALESLYADKLRGFFADLAFHYEKAEVQEKAIEYLEKAGDQARENFHNQVAIDFYQRLLGQLNNAPKELSLAADINLRLGSILERIGKWEEARSDYQASLDIATALGDELAQARACGSIGSTHSKKSEYETAIKYYERALGIRQTHNDSLGMSRSLGELSWTYLAQGDFDKAEALAHQKMALCERINDRLGLARANVTLGNIKLRRGALKEALSLYEQSTVIYTQLNDNARIASTRMNTGVTAMRMGQYETAQNHLQASLETFRKIGDVPHISNVLSITGAVYYYQNKLEQALIYWEQAYHSDREIGNWWGQISNLINIGSVHWAEHRSDPALWYLNQAREIAELYQVKQKLSSIYGNLSVIYKELGDIETALELTHKCLAIDRELRMKTSQAINLDNLGNIYYDQNDVEQATACYDEAIALGRDTGERYYLCSFLVHKARLLYEKTGDYAAARQLALEGLEIAREVKRQPMIFEAQLIDHQIEIKIGDAELGQWKMSELLPQAADDEQKAKWHLRMYELEIDQELHRHEALALYQKLYAKTSKVEFKKQIDHLTNGNGQK